MTYKGLLAASALGLAVVAGSAQAGPIVTQWISSNNAVFSAATFTSGTGTTTANASELSWGSPLGDFQNPGPDFMTNRSALTIGNVATGALTGGGPAVSTVTTSLDGLLTSPAEIGKGISFTHWNNPIDSVVKKLTGATITDTLTLTPNVPAVGPGQNGPTLVFNFQFRETENFPASGICADGTLSSLYPKGCPDLFGFMNTSTINQEIDYDGNKYFASVLTLDQFGNPTFGIGTLSNGACAALGLSPGCFGFRTDEGVATTERFGVFVSTAPIPEPGMLALLGLAFACFGVVRTARSRKLS